VTLAAALATGVTALFIILLDLNKEVDVVLALPILFEVLKDLLDHFHIIPLIQQLILDSVFILLGD